MYNTLVLADLSTGLGINTFAFLSQLISFGVVFFILWRWGFPAIIKILDERQAVIREGVENAQRAKRELTEATSRAEQVLLDARREAQQTIERASVVVTIRRGGPNAKGSDCTPLCRGNLRSGA